MEDADRTRGLHRVILDLSTSPATVLGNEEWDRGKKILGKVHSALQKYPSHRHQLNDLITNLRQTDTAFNAAYNFIRNSQWRMDCFMKDTNTFIARELKRKREGE